jgi:hypothetical protein
MKSCIDNMNFERIKKKEKEKKVLSIINQAINNYMRRTKIKKTL